MGAKDKEDSMEDSAMIKDSCNDGATKKKRQKSREADNLGSESAVVEKVQKEKKSTKMAEKATEVAEVVPAAKQNRKSDNSTAAKEDITKKSAKNKKADKMRLLKNSAKDCGFKGSNLGEIKSYGCAT